MLASLPPGLLGARDRALLLGARTITIESKTNFLGAARLDTRVLGECTALHPGKQTIVWQTRFLAEDGRLLAVVIQTQLVLEA